MCSRRIGRHETGGLTKTQQLRQAKTASRLKEIEHKEQSVRAPEASRRRVRSQYEPKKLDFAKPSMTKAMLARVKHAEKIKEEYERKTIVPPRMPKRTAAPIAGDARLGREKSARRHSIAPSTLGRSRTPSPSRFRESSFVERSSRRGPDMNVTEKAAELAKSMTADILESEPIGEGIIDSVVIPPGLVHEDRTTVVTIPQPTNGGSEFMNATSASQVANRSIQVISETLDEQDVAESNAVQHRLADLQQARRDFVIAVATVGGNSINIPDAEPQQRRLYRIPSLEDDMFRVEYGLDHPAVVAAREYAKKTKDGRDGHRRMDEEFEKYAREVVTDDLLGVPFEEDPIYQEPEMSWQEDEYGSGFPGSSRLRGYIPQSPPREEFYRYDPFDPDDLERFFDVQRHPPCQPSGPPAGREHLHPDLWELEDPWCRPPPEPDVPDLMHFSRD